MQQVEEAHFIWRWQFSLYLWQGTIYIYILGNSLYHNTPMEHFTLKAQAYFCNLACLHSYISCVFINMPHSRSNKYIKIEKLKLGISGVCQSKIKQSAPTLVLEGWCPPTFSCLQHGVGSANVTHIHLCEHTLFLIWTTFDGHWPLQTGNTPQELQCKRCSELSSSYCNSAIVEVTETLRLVHFFSSTSTLRTKCLLTGSFILHTDRCCCYLLHLSWYYVI